MLHAVTALLGLTILLAPGAAVREERPGRVVVDWTAGRVLATGAGAPDLRAPGPDVARVGAERAARQAAQRRAREAAAALPLAAGGTVGDRVAADPAAAGRLAAAAVRARDVEVDWFSDGGVEVTVALPLEAVRVALEAPPLPAASPDAPTAILVDARRVPGVRPALALTLVAGGAAAPYAGPVVWHRDARRAAADPRVGPRPVGAAAVRLTGGALELSWPAASLAAAAAAGALVVVIVGDPP